MSKVTKNEFNQFISFAFSDIDNSIEKAKSNFLCALGLMCYTEYIGGVIRNKVDIIRESKNNFNTALYRMGAGYEKFDKLLVELTAQDTYTMIRCGLVHNYYAKNFIVVSADTKDRSSLGLGFNHDNVPGIAIKNYSRDLREFANNTMEHYV